ncbi:MULTISPECIES: UDP-N-acetylmuramoyl-L-alanine--D-glutamate ligase [unclassified Bacillus (in: firmicutes)]|uniref:UDP-N-acetylmuramoyl-L-alanine--D-glutamate ligase n=1 Tax=unclassified Bacillus (in: firmicutes) TaxID=185979 RepID=UPI0008E4D451|nr:MULTISPECIES: UDP-N-acetylmuramoyl-L-alanine--D-glutamate ligase [unclassified Bacillus (in: firmicutes)]SFA75489.1 UDP-N-acetylmuramoylalanine--D-glutamate ligase [Bacillus sp. UNCCL13]SFQ65584.1 UDP-N-acetylmuramoylalanine--D-glutamate ligase [Bacillus sp. cl95]
MKEITEYQHKKILVLGLAKSGVSAAMLLHKLGAFVTVNDNKPLSENPEAQGLLEQGITVICGEHPLGLLEEGFQMIVKNPGIPYSNPMIKGAIEKGIPVLTEVELAYKISEAPFIGITGTNGKTTTTTLVFEMLNKGQKKPLIAGNIGTVASGVAQIAEKENTIVIELSSFQLMGINEFKPHIAMITNLYDAHLDYHGTRDEYIEAKANITRNQTKDDYLILNADQEEVMNIAKSSLAQTVPFSVTKKLENGACIEDGWISFKGEKVIDIDTIALPGAHNLENILGAVAAAKLLGVTNEAIAEVLTTFTGVKHRLQLVAEKDGRKFYNDSKATNILATVKALTAFKKPLVLLAGGLDRGNEFDELIPYLQNVKTIITFGQTAPKIERVAKEAGIKTIKRVDNVEKAVPEAYMHSASGDVILLSPACASWDQHKTFEVRGDIFIEAVHKL